MPKIGKAKTCNSKPIHPNSRKALQLARKEHHKLKRDKRREELSLKQQAKLDKLKWFKEHIDPTQSEYTAENITDFINRYLHRYDEELEQIDIIRSIKGRQNTQHVSRLDSVNFTIEKDSREFDTCGLEIPNLMNKKNLEFFLKWDGDPRYLTNINMKAFTKKNLQFKMSKPQLNTNAKDKLHDSKKTETEFIDEKLSADENFMQEET